MAKNSVKPHPKVGLVKNTPPSNEVKQNYEDLTSEQWEEREHKLNYMIGCFLIKNSCYARYAKMNKFCYKSLRFSFGERVNILGIRYIIVELNPEEKLIKIAPVNDFIKYFDSSIEMIKKGRWISLIKYSAFDDVRNLKKPIVKK